MKEISNLPRDLVEEVLCRTPLTSLRRVRSTCKNWNTLSRCESFAKKYLAGQAREREFMVVIMMDFRVYLMRVNLHNNNNNNLESYLKCEGELISLGDEVKISQVFHCDGLLLCINISEEKTRLVVWNPYWGHTRTIEPTHNFPSIHMYSYAFGYDKSSKSHKILMFMNMRDEFNIYDFNSDSWRVLNVTTTHWTIWFTHYGVTLKGNVYLFAREKANHCDFFLVCFDFTRDTFGPLLPLPFAQCLIHRDTMSVSSVREEQLAFLFHPWHTLRMEIWITSKIEPHAVSWNSKVFLSVSIKQLIDPQYQFNLGSFFVDEEKKVAVVFENGYKDTRRNMAYIFGVDGSLKEVDLGESAYEYCYPLVCSYVPSLVQVNQVVLV
ncbi:hypothetical protein CARUB_v10016342mg [Capsella rubella]|uniref:F-box domain-containing protein n=1 Tax=Capsella rubella TaxID=81985 RepID=R0GBQ4_9BRAS|nr:F-box protein At3g19470 [Capsella rubella]EOA33011.1 hypothetical protein CARUB_v10016342mg [Capsella rubella]